MSVANQVSDQFGGERREEFVKFAAAGIEASFPGIEWILLDFRADPYESGEIEWVEIADPSSPQISFRVEHIPGTANSKSLTVAMWSEGVKLGEASVNKGMRGLATEIAKLPEYRLIHRESAGFGKADR